MRHLYTRILIFLCLLASLFLSLLFSTLLVYVISYYLDGMQLESLKIRDQGFMLQLQKEAASALIKPSADNGPGLEIQVKNAMSSYRTILENNYIKDIRVLNREGQVVFSFNRALIGKPENNPNFLKSLQGIPYTTMVRLHYTYYYYTAYPLYGNSQTVIGAVGMAQNLKPVFMQMQRMRLNLGKVIIILLGSLFLLLLLILFLANREIRALEREQMRDQRMAAMGNLAAGMAHEIKNPLNSISLSIQYLDRLTGKSAVSHEQLKNELKENLPLIGREIDRLKEILDEFIGYVRPQTLNLQPVALAEVIREAVNLFAAEAAAHHVELRVADVDNITLPLDREKMHGVFVNLIKNALEAMSGGGRLDIKTLRKRKQIEIIIEDTGVGIAAEDLPHIFEPYFTTKKNGLGLGLSLIMKTIESHGGRIQVLSQPGRGAQFIINLPAG